LKSKIIDRSALQERLASLREQGLKIVFTNGCFDLLHAGHVAYLEKARSLGDCLVVGLNSDRSIKMIKDPRRPLVSEDQRAEVLAGLACIDWVVLFDEPDPYALIKDIRPDILAKGADWEADQIIGADLVTESGGAVRRIELVPGISTSEIIQRIIRRYCDPAK
jgi:D-beta-D-heptose 7-phosphate kinase/D-beta-D-heptose 1-phosphate adenosyltransferase